MGIATIIDSIKTFIFISIGVMLGFSFGVIVGLNGLIESYTLLPSWIWIVLCFMIAVGIFSFIILYNGRKNSNKIEEIKQ